MGYIFGLKKMETAMRMRRYLWLGAMVLLSLGGCAGSVDQLVRETIDYQAPVAHVPSVNLPPVWGDEPGVYSYRETILSPGASRMPNLPRGDCPGTLALRWPRDTLRYKNTELKLWDGAVVANDTEKEISVFVVCLVPRKK